MPFNKEQFEKNKEELEEKIKKKTAGNTEDIVGAYKTIINNASGGNNKDFWGDLVAYKTDDTNLTILERAILDGNHNLVQAILEECPADQLFNLLIATNADGNNAMHLAVLHGKYGIVNAIFDKCATNAQSQQLLEAQNNAGDTPLHLEARNGISYLFSFNERVQNNIYINAGNTLDETKKDEIKSKIANTANKKDETVLQLFIQNTDPDNIKLSTYGDFASSIIHRKERLKKVLSVKTQNDAIEALKVAAGIEGDINTPITSTDNPITTAQEQTRQFIVAIQNVEKPTDASYAAVVNATRLWKHPEDESAQKDCLNSAEKLADSKSNAMQKAGACLMNLIAAHVVAYAATLCLFAGLLATSLTFYKVDAAFKPLVISMELGYYSKHLFDKGTKRVVEPFFKTGKEKQKAGAALDNFAKKPPTRPK